MTENERFRYFYAPLVVALCSTVDTTASRDRFFTLDGWPDPYFSPAPTSPYRSRPPDHYFPPYPRHPSARHWFDPRYESRDYYYPYPAPDRPPYRSGPPHRDAPYSRPDSYGSRGPHDPHRHHRPPPPAVKTLHLDEGDFCRRGHGLYPDYLCVNAKNCSEPLAKSFRNDNHLDICSFDGTEPIVCCPTSTRKSQNFSHLKIQIIIKPLGKPPANFVRPSFEIKVTSTDIDQNPDTLSTSENFPSEAPVDDTQKTKAKTTTPIDFAVQSPSIDEIAIVPDTDMSLISNEASSKPSIKEVSMKSTSSALPANDKISSNALDATQPPTKVSATDPDTNNQQNIEKIFSGPKVVRPPMMGTELNPDFNTILSLEQPEVNVIQPSIEETVVSPDANGQDDTSQNLNISTKKCRQYITVAYPNDVDTHDKIISGADPARSYHYPHMAIIGYGKTVENKNEWKCGGSLISERWILTAAHCYKIGSLARWVRLGVEFNPGILDVRSSENDARTEDYQIIEHVLHPDFRKSGRYNDIALFCLEKDVEFSAYVRPICLNSDPLLNPSTLVSASWGRTSTGERQSDFLLETTLDVIPENKCKQSYLSINDPKVRFGIQSDSMICASSRIDDGDTCSGVSGGPLQEENVKKPNSYTLFGVTSFCGTQEYPGVYTRVSKYIQWIEEVVWSND